MRWFLSLVPAIGLGAAASSAQSIERMNPEGMTQPSAYHHVVRAGNLLFIAGQVALDGSGALVGAGDMRAQLEQVLENLKRALASQGADFSHVVKITTFTTDIESFREARGPAEQSFGGHPPASTLVEVRRLARPEFLLEIEAVAVLPEDR